MEKGSTGGSRRGSESGSRIPVLSPSPSACYTPTLGRKVHPPSTLEKHRSLQYLNYGQSREHDDDTDSVRSFASNYSSCSTASAQCFANHSPFGKNGTTYSGRQNKYIVHCSSSSGSPEQYLTPTQRATCTIRHLKTLLKDTKMALDDKEKEIARLTKEVVELKLKKAESPPFESPQSLHDSHELNGHPETISLGESSLTDGPSPASYTLPKGGGSPFPLAASTSLSDSGHFEELSPHPSPRNSFLERELDKLKHQHEEEIKALRNSSDAQMTNLVQRIAEANDRNFDLNAQLASLQVKISTLEQERQDLQNKYKENEEKHKNAYLQMFNKGQQMAIYQHAGESNDGSPILTVSELIKQLEITKRELDNVKTMYKRLLETKKPKEQDAEVTLQFLKSAVFYFLTDRENTARHLAAIQSILGFSSDEKQSIEKAIATSSYVGWK